MCTRSRGCRTEERRRWQEGRGERRAIEPGEDLGTRGRRLGLLCCHHAAMRHLEGALRSGGLTTRTPILRRIAQRASDGAPVRDVQRRGGVVHPGSARLHSGVSVAVRGKITSLATAAAQPSDARTWSWLTNTSCLPSGEKRGSIADVSAGSVAMAIPVCSSGGASAAPPVASPAPAAAPSVLGRGLASGLSAGSFLAPLGGGARPLAAARCARGSGQRTRWQLRGKQKTRPRRCLRFGKTVCSCGHATCPHPPPDFPVRAARHGRGRHASRTARDAMQRHTMSRPPSGDHCGCPNDASPA